MSLEAQLMAGSKIFPKNLGGLLNLPYYGNVFYVQATNGSDTNSGTTPDKPFATIATAALATTAALDDVIVVLPGHAETVTTTITLSKSRVRVIGVGEGNQRPLITPNLAGDNINITGAGVVVENLRFAAPLTDNQASDINVAAAGVTLRNLFSLGSVATENKVDQITVASGGDDLLVEGCRAYNTVVDVTSWLSLEAAVARPVIQNNVVMGTYATGNLMDEATATLVYVRNNVFKNTKTTGACLTFTTGNSTGVCSFNHLSGRNTTILSNSVTGTGMDFFENRVTEEVSLNGAIIPAADAE